MLLWLTLLVCISMQGQEVLPLRQAHSHNDYLHSKPLLDALEQGFCSVEADIFLGQNNALLVGHTKQELKSERTLEALYFNPLRELARKNHGSIFLKSAGSPKTIYLFIDLKTPASTTYPVLHRLLEKYSEILTEVRNGKVTERAVTVILSGSRPALQELANQSPRFAAYDGRLSDLSSTVPSHLMPVISDNWQTQIRWSGLQPISPSDKQKLDNIVKQAHKHQRKVRFWATPERETVWLLLHELNVDLINTDKLSELKSFLLKQKN